MSLAHLSLTSRVLKYPETVIMMGGAVEGAVWTNAGAAFCRTSLSDWLLHRTNASGIEPIACYWALILINTLDTCPAENEEETECLLDVKEKSGLMRYTDIV